MLGFSQAQVSTLFDYFDVDSSGTVSYDEFLRSIRGPMNMARKKIVAQAYKKLDKMAMVGLILMTSEVSTRLTSTQMSSLERRPRIKSSRNSWRPSRLLTP
jgi:hypothetical protein